MDHSHAHSIETRIRTAQSIDYHVEVGAERVEAVFGRLTQAALAVKRAFTGLFTPIRPAAQAAQKDLAQVQGSARQWALAAALDDSVFHPSFTGKGT
jgi:hypothetical protein